MSTPAALWDRAAELELELATLEAELEAFHADYLRQVGVLVAQVHDVEAKILDARGEVEAARAAHQRARLSSAEVAAVPSPPGPLPTDDLKALFRQAAKRMHPDVAGDEAGRAHAEAFMKRLNQAYRAADTEAMLDLVRQWEASPFAGPGGGPEERAAAQAAVADVERRLAEVRGSELARLMEDALAAAVRGEDLLAELRAQWAAALADARARLAAITP